MLLPRFLWTSSMKPLISFFLVLMLLVDLSVTFGREEPAGNLTFQSFNKAKKALEQFVVPGHRVTLYCQAPFDENKNIRLPSGFETAVHQKRASRVEWEHVVPAENFGKFFTEWREGSPRCIDNRGRAFKGRKCAEKENVMFRFMQSDMYNLYPSIGAVNAERGNKNFEILPSSIPNTFGSCAMKISGNKAEPPQGSRGVIARTYKYMAHAYPDYFRMSQRQARLMDAWDKSYPVQKWECERAKKIQALQGNENPFVSTHCKR